MVFNQLAYTRTDLNDFSNEWNGLVQASKASKSAQEQIDIHMKLTELIEQYYTMSSLAYIRHTLNTEDSFYSSEQDYYDENGPHFVKLLMDYYNNLVKSPYRDELEKALSPLVFEKIELQLKGFDERIIPFMQEESKLSTAYAKLLASAEFEFDGKKLNLPMLTLLKPLIIYHTLIWNTSEMFFYHEYM